MAVNIVGANTTDGGSFIDLMKRLQPQAEVEKLWKQTYALLGSMRKKGDFVGTQIDIPLEHDHPGRSRTFAQAQSNRQPSSSLKYSLTRARDYSTGRLDAETMHASKNDMGSWLRALQRETSNTQLALRKNTAMSLYRDHGGSIGVVSAIGNGDGTGDRITLTLKSDAYNFSNGQAILIDPLDGTAGGAPTDSDPVFIRKIDFENGYLFCSLTQGGAAGTITTNIAAATDTDFIFNDGDFGVAFRGLASWLPLTTPSAGESYLGIDRSVDPARLAGHRLNDTSMSREEIVQELAARIMYTGGSNLTCYMAPIQVKQFALELDTKVVRDPGGTGKVGFRGIVVDTVAGPVEVLGDPSCPENRMYMIDLSCWTFHHLEALPHLVEDDGLQRVRVSDADQIEFRYRLWGNLACTAPGKNAVAALPAAF